MVLNTTIRTALDEQRDAEARRAAEIRHAARYVCCVCVHDAFLWVLWMCSRLFCVCTGYVVQDVCIYMVHQEMKKNGTSHTISHLQHHPTIPTHKPTQVVHPPSPPLDPLDDR